MTQAKSLVSLTHLSKKPIFVYFESRSLIMGDFGSKLQSEFVLSVISNIFQLKVFIR